MEKIESSLFTLLLDDEKPRSVDDVPNHCMNGDYNNRWADKSITIVVFKNGLFGTISDVSFGGSFLLGE